MSRRSASSSVQSVMGASLVGSPTVAGAEDKHCVTSIRMNVFDGGVPEKARAGKMPDDEC